MCRSVAKIVTTSRWSKNNCISKFGIPESKILHYPNGVDLAKFDIEISKEEARKSLNLESFKFIILYSGHLYEWKGAHILAQSSGLLHKSAVIIFVGGTDEDVASFGAKYSSDNVIVLGRKPHTDIPLYLKSADILVLPNVPITPHSIESTSPIKLFEYMASKRPIIASDLPSIRELLSPSNAILVAPGSPTALADGINNLLEEMPFGLGLAETAYGEVKKWSWKNRARSIIDFVKR